MHAAVPSLPPWGAVFNKSRRKRVEFTEAAHPHQKHDSCCPYAQLTARSSGRVEKAALVFQIKIGNQFTTFNSRAEESRNNTNKQSNKWSNTHKITTEMQSSSLTVTRHIFSVSAPTCRCDERRWSRQSLKKKNHTHTHKLLTVYVLSPSSQYWYLA